MRSPSFPITIRRRPKRGSRSPVLRRRRFRRKGKSLFQLLKRGGNCSRHKVAELAVGEEEMEVSNMRLCMENRCIMEENRRLHKRALALRLENQLLFAQLHHGDHLKVAAAAHEDDDGGGNQDGVGEMAVAGTRRA